MSAPAQSRGWRESLAIYAHPRVVTFLFLGFSAGLPFLLVFSTLSAWLREFGVSRTAIGFISWIGITYSIKFVWSPVVDRVPLPLLTRWLGRRRSWMLLAQTGIGLGLLAMSFCDPRTDLWWLAVFAVVVAFSSATQDIALDAFRIEATDETLQGATAATYQLGYRIAVLAAGAGALYIAEFGSWPAAYITMAALGAGRHRHHADDRRAGEARGRRHRRARGQDRAFAEPLCRPAAGAARGAGVGLRRHRLPVRRLLRPLRLARAWSCWPSSACFA